MENLAIEGLTKTYGKLKALDNFSYSLGSGVYGLLGPNGAGKSTLMKLVTQNIRPDSGKILYKKKNINKLGSDFRKLIGYMPQQQSFYKNFTAARFLSYVSALKGMDKKAAALSIERVLHAVRLFERRNDRLDGFSGGMRQRILIAQALLGDPEILLLDEPTAGLDPVERIRIRSIISEISGEKTVLLASHIVSDIEQIAKRVLILKKGRLICADSPHELIKSLSGRCFTVNADASELDKYKNKFLISNVAFSESGLDIKLILKEGEGPKSSYIPRTPTLEDVYLNFFSQDYVC